MQIILLQLLRVVKSSLWLTSKKIPRTMRLFILFLICSMSFVHATDERKRWKSVLSAQESNCRESSEKNRKAIGLWHLTMANISNLKRVVSVSVDKSNIFKVLDEIFEGTDVKYSVLDKRLFCLPEVTSKQQQAVKISGKVVKSSTENQLIDCQYR